MIINKISHFHNYSFITAGNDSEIHAFTVIYILHLFSCCFTYFCSIFKNNKMLDHLYRVPQFPRLPQKNFETNYINICKNERSTNAHNVTKYSKSPLKYYYLNCSSSAWAHFMLLTKKKKKKKAHICRQTENCLQASKKFVLPR